MFANQIELTIVLSTLVILIMISGVIITMFIANKKHITQQIAMVQIRADYEKELRLTEHEVQEQVLTQVSRELHDNVGQRLTIVKIQLERYKINNPTASVAINEIAQTFDEAIMDLRRLNQSLNTDLLEHTSFVEAVTNEIARLEKLHTYGFHWDKCEEPPFDKDQRLMMFRIFQEVMNNMMKHAKAQNVYLSCTVSPVFHFKVADDGTGFDVKEKMNTGNGSGLRNIMKRAALAGIAADVVSSSAGGTVWNFTQIQHNTKNTSS